MTGTLAQVGNGNLDIVSMVRVHARSILEHHRPFEAAPTKPGHPIPGTRFIPQVGRSPNFASIPCRGESNSWRPETA